MAHVEDRWTVPGPTGRRVHGPRWGNGKRWQAVWYSNGRPSKRSFDLKEAAVGHLAAVEVEQRAGTYVRPTAVTVAEFGDRWVTLQLHHRASTREHLEIAWRRYIRDALGARRLVDVTPGMVQDAVIAWSAVLAPTTIEVVYGYAATLFKAAVADRLIRVTPCQRVRLPEIVRGLVVPLTVDQVLTIAGRMTGPQQPRGQYRAMVLLGAATGLRPGELRGLTIDRCLFTGGGLRIRVDRQLVATAPTWGPPKTASSVRTVPVDEETSTMLRRHVAEQGTHQSGLLFTGRNRGPIARTSAAEVWQRATVDLGLPARSGWHALRHFHASMLIRGGLSPVAVAARLGHKDATETLRTYGHLWHDDDARAADAVARGLWARQHPESTPLRIIAGQGSE